MDDRTLLELAAKAAYEVLPTGGVVVGGYIFDIGQGDRDMPWNPLTDDGDALRLAVKLKFSVDVSIHHTVIRWNDDDLSESHSLEQWDNGMTPEEWTRRAIVRAAAEIGKSI